MGADVTPPPEGTIERAAFDYITSEDLRHKLDPPPWPSRWEQGAKPRRIEAPSRPSSLVIATKARKTPGPVALRDKARRAEVVHTFLHHELQAAELFCWAILAFPETPEAFRRGLLGVARDEVRHMAMYREVLARLGFVFGDYPVRDWFWKRVPQVPSAVHFVAVMGMGFEGGNLDHAARFAERFRASGDEDSALVQEKVCAEEIAHVHFAHTWFERWTGASDFDTWLAHLPAPLSPILMRGDPINTAFRARAGLSESFVTALADYQPDAQIS